MDHSYPYIASLTREPFLFYEMRSTAKLMAEGNILAKCLYRALRVGWIREIEIIKLYNENDIWVK